MPPRTQKPSKKSSAKSGEKNAADAALCAAFLHLAAQGWDKVTLPALAKAIKTSPEKLSARFADIYAVIPALAAEITRQAHHRAGTPTGTHHDRLFDALMARFDILQKNRKAHELMAEAAKRDRALACALSRALYAECGATYDAALADTETSALPRPLQTLALMGIFGWGFAAWRRDSSRDMSKTMAALDRALRLADKAANLIASSNRKTA